MTRKLDRAQRQYDNQVPDDYYESDDALALREYRELEASLPEEVEDFADLLHAYKQGLKREENAKRRYAHEIKQLKAEVIAKPSMVICEEQDGDCEARDRLIARVPSDG